MTFLLDTNVVSALGRRRGGDERVRRWAQTQRLSDFYISVITLAEIETGVLRIARKDRLQGDVLRRWLDDYIAPRFKERTLPVDAAIARRTAALHVPDPRPFADALIAATALVHSLTVVTRNTPDFSGTGVALLNPWEAARP